MSRRTEKHERIIASAPGKDLIQSLCHGGEPTVLVDFFATRTLWCGGYPLVHDRFVTYGAFDDLLGALDSKRRLALLPTALHIAEIAADRQFHAALSLLGYMIPDDAIRLRPLGFSDALLRLRLRAEKLSFLPNLTSAWDAVVTRQRCLKSPDDFLSHYSPMRLAIAHNSWQRFFRFPLINHAHRLFAEAALPMALLRECIQGLGAMPGERKLIFSTRIETTRYWVWRLPGKSGPAHLSKIIFLRMPHDGQPELGTWNLYRQFSERETPDALSRRLMQIEFYPSKLAALTDGSAVAELLDS